MRSCLCALLLALPAWAQGPDPFAGEDNAAAAEHQPPADLLPGRFALRLRAQGTPGRLRQYQRLAWKGATQEFHLLVERDAGEPRWNDLTAAAYHWRPSSRLALSAGDLRPAYAQGLVFGRPGGRGAPFPSLRQDQDDASYRGSGENTALRGLALGIGAGSWVLSLVSGRARRDARLGAEGQVVSLPGSGLHRSGTEAAGQGLLGLWVAGARLRRTTPAWQWGLTVQSLHFDRRLDLRRRGQPAFHGEAVRLAGTDLQWRWRALRTGAEMAVDRRGRLGLLGLGSLRLGGLNLGSTWRRYAADFPAFLSGAPGRSPLRDETGLLLSAAGRWRHLQAHLWTDGWGPVQGAERHRVWGASLHRSLRPDLQLELAAQQRSGAEARTRAELSWSPYARRELAARFEFCRTTAGQRGRLFSLRATSQGPRLRWTWHLSRFHTGGYASRLYEYEYDLPGAFGIRPLYGRGWRWYLLAAHTRGPLRLAARFRRQQGQQQAGLQLDLDWPP